MVDERGKGESRRRSRSRLYITYHLEVNAWCSIEVVLMLDSSPLFTL